MKWCEFKTLPDGRYWCDGCKAAMPRGSALPIWRQCKPGAKTSPCASLGEMTRVEECGTCASKPRIKVFACAIHTECTLGKPLDGIACCATCADYSANPTPTAT